MENAGGHNWVTIKIPDNSYFVSANQSRIGNVDLNDKENVLSSPNLLSFAKKEGLYNSKTDGDFSFRKVFGKDTDADKSYNYNRVKYLQNLFTPSQKKLSYSDNSFPTLLVPETKISLTDVEKALQSHYNNTEQDAYNKEDASVSPRPISVYRTRQSHILTRDPKLPLPIANIEYLNLGMTALGIYVPFYQGSTPPYAYTVASKQADNVSAYWKYRKLQMMGMLNFPEYAPIIQKRLSLLNDQIQHEQNTFEKMYLSLCKKDPEGDKILLNNFTTQTAEGSLAVAQDLTNQLMTIQSSKINQEYLFSGA